MKYGYNDAGTKGCGVVHIFADRQAYEAALPFCRRRQHYIPAYASEAPKCRICEFLARANKQGGNDNEQNNDVPTGSRLDSEELG